MPAGLTTHSAVYEALASAIEAAGYTRDHHLLGNAQSPSPLRSGSFRMEPTGYVDTGVYAVQREGAMRIADSITVHLADPMDVQQEASWLAARVRANAVVSALLLSTVQVVDLAGVASTLDGSGNYIMHAVDVVCTYDIAVT